jgi:tetratricopeptide (TPR) repeat protein
MTRDSEKFDNLETEPFEGDGPGVVRNTACGVVGAVMQAGVVRGDVHLHSAPLPPVPVVPRQLPAAPGLFAGRVVELAELNQALTGTRPDAAVLGAAGPGAPDEPPADVAVGSAAVVVSAIGGAGGMGKTWLALLWAHRHLDRFPDGQLFVDLHGFSPTQEPMAPATAVRGFLDGLGVDPGRIPSDLDAQAALYRSLVADRRMLIMLDNAATTDQVVPLLPGSSACTVLVTSRTRLASLIDRYGARHLCLGVLTRAEARVLLTARVGADRVAAESGAVDELVELCGGYPLALSITARNAATRPTIPLAEIAAELRDLGLDVLDNEDPTASLPMVLSWSLRRLTTEQRMVFALLGIAPGPDIDLLAATSLTGLTQVQTRKALRVLEEHSLLDRRPQDRYSMHDLVRAYAATAAHNHLTDQVQRSALERVVDHYVHTAHTAALLLDPHRVPIPLAPPVPGSQPRPLPDLSAGLAWLDTHHPHLLAAQRTAAHHHRHQAVWHLAWALPTFHQRRGHRHDALAVWQAAANAASQLPDPAALIVANRFLGHAHAELGRHEQAIRHLHHALDLAEQHDDSAQQAHTHHNLAVVWERKGNDRQALEHARRTLALYRGLDSPPAWEADALNAVGWLAARLGDYDTAHDHCRQALELQRQHHHPDGEATTQDSLGFIEHSRGHHDRAIAHYLQALTLFRALGVTTEVAHTLDRLGHPHTALGQYDHARSVWQEALELYREQGRDEDVGRVRRQLGDLASASNSNRPLKAGDTAESASA